MVSPSRTSSSPLRRDYAGKMFVGALILLGLVASIFLIFSDSLQFIRIGLVAALWAAVLGALAATKYRKESTVDKAKVRDLQTVYELQLDREISARREYELGVEARVRQEVGADAAEMAALRAELTVLRQNLQRLFDGDLPMDRPALRADSTRIQELTGRPAGSANVNSANADGWVGPRLPRDSVTPVYDTDHPQPPVFASPFDDPVTAETSIITLDRDEADTAADATAASGSWADAFAESSSDPDADAALADAYRSGAAAWGAADHIVVGPPAPAAQSRTVMGPPAPREAESEPDVAAGSTSAGTDAPPTSVSGTPAPMGASAPETTSAGPSTAPAGPPTAPEASAGPATSARPAQTAPTFGSASSRRRRRAESESDDSSSKRLSVAEILANLQSEQSNGSR
ncbi:hypothetical protein GV792_24205 [Nocardia cyriacigeorgica]|uniref:DUF6779 domain-containing protein n=1 Tax=Nocardia cyriacigeorgica TaxID=135487 RepID=A0A6P1D7C9_9NOCA|nr:DUF6779 domain-containing protein [Nocardia cyriacigeorgica]NEW42058.1 hypothetical protein [Nocardia cyriacigeorgica]NEW44900.1 hypothetical protein [Nocardia cyriacigeorgica]NEW53136.1 hypothetical protein [Nocardia cyriacigeorgica]